MSHFMRCRAACAWLRVAQNGTSKGHPKDIRFRPSFVPVYCVYCTKPNTIRLRSSHDPVTLAPDYLATQTSARADETTIAPLLDRDSGMITTCLREGEAGIFVTCIRLLLVRLT